MRDQQDVSTYGAVYVRWNCNLEHYKLGFEARRKCERRRSIQHLWAARLVTRLPVEQRPAFAESALEILPIELLQQQDALIRFRILGSFQQLLNVLLRLTTKWRMAVL